MTPVSMTAVMTLSLARSRTAVVRPGYRAWSCSLAGKGEGNTLIAGHQHRIRKGRVDRTRVDIGDLVVRDAA